jgi:hypothetical protein
MVLSTLRRPKKRFISVKILIAICLLLISLSVSAQITYQDFYVDYDSAWEYRNLRIIPIRKKDPGPGPAAGMMSLSQALKKGVASVSERGSASTENVHWLRIKNRSGRPLFVASGEMINGGRQDRMVTKDTVLLATDADQYVSVMCIEQERWSEKEKKFQYGNFANQQLRKVLDQTKNQLSVWKDIYSQIESADVKAPTLAFNARRLNKKYLLQGDDYLSFFHPKFKTPDSTIAGIICVSGNKVIGSDIFAETRIFYEEIESLLYGYIDEVLMRGSEPMLTNDEVREYADKILTDEATQEAFCRTNGKIFRFQKRVVHVNTY